jgi:hypothetical protein
MLGKKNKSTIYYFYCELLHGLIVQLIFLIKRYQLTVLRLGIRYQGANIPMIATKNGLATIAIGIPPVTMSPINKAVSVSWFSAPFLFDASERALAALRQNAALGLLLVGFIL